MTVQDLWQAKVAAVAGFASGPVMMLDDEKERDKRLASLLAVLEMEHDAMGESVHRHPSQGSAISQIRPRTNMASIVGSTIHASNSRINWYELVDWLRAHPGVTKTLIYDDMHTVVVTAGRTRKKFPDLDVMTERREGSSGAVLLMAP